MSIEETEAEVIEEFSMVDDWMDRYSMLIDLGNELPALPEELKTQQNLIEGCQSRVWLVAEKTPSDSPLGGERVITFRGDSDAILVKGIVALLIRVLSGHTPQEILDAKLDFIEQIGLREHLSPTRSNGLSAMVKQMKLYAVAFSAHN